MMYSIYFLLISFTLFNLNTLTGQTDWRKVENSAFRVGEKLTFRVYYDAWLTGKVTAGIGITEVKETKRTFGGRQVYHIDTEGMSKGLFNLFFKVHDEFDSFVDKEFMAPHHFIRKTREGGYRKFDEYNFNHAKDYVVTRSDSLSIPKYTQDFISVVFYARTINSDTLKPGDIIYVNFFLNDSVYNSAIIFEGRETIETSLGKIRCLRLKPMVAVGEVFTEKYPMTLWVSDDKNHVPVLAQSAVYVGNIKMELTEYEGLANPFTALTERKKR
ncbi:MAG: DUF3108 domain-containing protein [Bacteroidales bacterium]